MSDEVTTAKPAMTPAEESAKGLRKPEFLKPPAEMVQELIAVNNELTSRLGQLTSLQNHQAELHPYFTKIVQYLADTEKLFSFMDPKAFEGDGDLPKFLSALRKRCVELKTPMKHHELQLKARAEEQKERLKKEQEAIMSVSKPKLLVDGT